MAHVLDMFKNIGLWHLADILLLSWLIYIVLIGFRRSRDSLVLMGIVIVASVYFLAFLFDLVLITEVFKKFFTVILVAFVVIFQEDLRQFFERVAVWSLNRSPAHHAKVAPGQADVVLLVRTLTDLAKLKIGALIVVRGRDRIVRHMSGGVSLNGQLSEPLLKSLFDPHSIGHDGAVIVENDQVSSFCCHLPLSRNLKKIGQGGTRHAAALGLSELSDALCLVVSEEQGTISAARHGDILIIADPETLAAQLEAFYQEMHPVRLRPSVPGFFRRNWPEKILAIALSLILWTVLVQGSRLTYKTFTVPVMHTKLPADLKAVEMTPEVVDVTFRGPQNAFYFLSQEQIKLFLKLAPKPGLQTVRISSANLVFPEQLTLETSEPKEVTLRLEKDKPAASFTGLEAIFKPAQAATGAGRVHSRH